MQTPIYTIHEFCELVQNNLTGFIEERLKQTPRKVNEEEKKAWLASYEKLAAFFSAYIPKNPEIGSIQMILEYKLPSVSCWCDVVLLGADADNHPKAIIIELKNYLKNTSDKPGTIEGLICHHSKSRYREEQLHPSDQVRGYTDFCRYFHSTILDENAQVYGCVYFTSDISLEPYRAIPNDKLTENYPPYNLLSEDGLYRFISQNLVRGNKLFAEHFREGYYRQNKNILLQVANCFQAQKTYKRPFILLKEQRRGLRQVQSIVDKVYNSASDEKHVIIVQGPPGSGKSAVAINLWFESVLKYVNIKNKKDQNVTYVTTSSSQCDNWSHIFKTEGGTYNASRLLIKANAFNPGLSGYKIYNKKHRYLDPLDQQNPEKYTYWKKENGELKKAYLQEYWKDYLDYMEGKNDITYKDNQHLLSIVDEAHALIDPSSRDFSCNKISGWCYQAGPQAYHIIRASKISVFFMDNRQGFRENETTKISDIRRIAREHFSVEPEFVDLSDMQFRCGGSTEYVDWIENLFTSHPLHNATKWLSEIPMEIVDDPFELDRRLRAYQKTPQEQMRLVSSYSVKWISPDRSKLLGEHIHDLPKTKENMDFYLDINSGKYTKVWNVLEGKKKKEASYTNYILGTSENMSKDPLCEVGCPYVVRGFDYEHIGILWLDDLIYRHETGWNINLSHCEETAIQSIRKKVRKSNKGKEMIPYDEKDPYIKELFERVTGTYRILMTRATKHNLIYIKDKETRNYILTLLTD